MPYFESRVRQIDRLPVAATPIVKLLPEALNHEYLRYLQGINTAITES
jgi:hypothetical protein